MTPAKLADELNMALNHYYDPDMADIDPLLRVVPMVVGALRTMQQPQLDGIDVIDLINQTIRISADRGAHFEIKRVSDAE